jgi:hypothetical protein
MQAHAPDDFDPVRDSDDLIEADRRGYARYRVRGEWFVVDHARRRALGDLLDIGIGGLRIQAPEPIPPARRYTLAIEGSVDGKDQPAILVAARCAWHCAQPDRQFVAGFEFVELSPQMRTRIALLIDELAL